MLQKKTQHMSFMGTALHFCRINPMQVSLFLTFNMFAHHICSHIKDKADLDKMGQGGPLPLQKKRLFRCAHAFFSIQFPRY